MCVGDHDHTTVSGERSTLACGGSIDAIQNEQLVYIAHSAQLSRQLNTNIVDSYSTDILLDSDIVVTGEGTRCRHGEARRLQVHDRLASDIAAAQLN